MKPTRLFSMYLFYLLLPAIILPLKISAQDQQKFVGRWNSGDVTFTSYKPSLNARTKNHYLRIDFVIEENEGKLSGKMKSPDSHVLWMDADKTIVSHDTISLYFDKINAIYSAEISEDGNDLNGVLKLKGRMISIGLKKETE